MLGLALGFALGSRSVLGIADARSGPPPGRRAAQDGIPRACVWISGYHLCLHPRESRPRSLPRMSWRRNLR
jgi:hypothetical protein